MNLLNSSHSSSWSLLKLSHFVFWCLLHKRSFESPQKLCYKISWCMSITITFVNACKCMFYTCLRMSIVNELIQTNVKIGYRTSSFFEVFEKWNFDISMSCQVIEYNTRRRVNIKNRCSSFWVAYYIYIGLQYSFLLWECDRFLFSIMKF